jgi:hypothetical protein
VYARDKDKGCYFCGGYVDQTLPRGHPWSKTCHHIVELQDGGELLDPEWMHIAHLGCNSSAGAKRAAQRKAELKAQQSAFHVDASTI